MAITSTPSNYSNLCSGRLAAKISTTTSTGITVTADSFRTPAGTGSVTWPTGNQIWKVSRKTRTNTEVEYIGVESLTQTGTAITTGTVIRYLSPTDGTSFATAGDGLSFPAGSVVELIWDVRHAEQTAFKNNANTFTATNTFSSGLIMTATDKAFVPPTVTTTQRDNIASPSNGMIVYNSTTGVLNQYLGGAWTTFASGTTSNAANNTGGKVDLATAAENAAGTATDASSGAPNVIPTSIVKATSTGAVSGTVPMLNTSVMLDGTIGGLGSATPVLGALKIGGGVGLAMTDIGPGTSGQVVKSNGTTLAMGGVPSFIQPVAISTTDSSTLGASSTADFVFNNHTYTIPADELVAGVIFECIWEIANTWAAGNATVRLKLGGSSANELSLTVATNMGTMTRVHSRIYGTTTAGASVSVKCSTIATFVDSSQLDGSARYDTVAAVATNGTLVIECGGTFGTSNAGNNMICKASEIRKISTTAF